MLGDYNPFCVNNVNPTIATTTMPQPTTGAQAAQVTRLLVVFIAVVTWLLI